MTIRVTMLLIAFFTIGNINSASADPTVTVPVPVPNTVVTTNTSNNKVSVPTVPVPIPTTVVQSGSNNEALTQLPSVISIVAAPEPRDTQTNQEEGTTVIVTPPTPGVKASGNLNNEKSTKQVSLTFQTSEKKESNEPTVSEKITTVVERDDLETLPPAQPAEIQAVTTDSNNPSYLWGLFGFTFTGALLGLGAFAFNRRNN
ncbi:MAG: hypothetical protein ACKOW9_04560 [Candidatus Paceibacterota bacterium]